MRMELLTDYGARKLIPFLFGIIPGNPLSAHGMFCNTGTINLIPLAMVLIHCQPRNRTPCSVSDSFVSAEYYIYKICGHCDALVTGYDLLQSQFKTLTRPHYRT